MKRLYYKHEYFVNFFTFRGKAKREEYYLIINLSSI
jgi:uncharacterized membrane protein YhaH (DUF805 family)